jgi:hypothetical protein
MTTTITSVMAATARLQFAHTVTLAIIRMLALLMGTGALIISLMESSSELAPGTDGDRAADGVVASVIATDSDADLAMVAGFAVAAGSVEIGAALGTEAAFLTALLAGIAVASHTGAETSMVAADSMAEVAVASTVEVAVLMAEVAVASTVAVAGFMAEVAVASTAVADRTAADTVAAIGN